MITVLESSLRAPHRFAMLGELSSALNLAQMLPALALARRESARFAAASPIVVLPGFGTDDTSTLPLRHFLRRKGFAALRAGHESRGSTVGLV